MKVEDFVDPFLGKSWGELGARVLTSGSQVAVTLGYPALGMREELQQALSAHLGGANALVSTLFAGIFSARC